MARRLLGDFREFHVSVDSLAIESSASAMRSARSANGRERSRRTNQASNSGSTGGSILEILEQRVLPSQVVVKTMTTSRGMRSKKNE